MTITPFIVNEALVQFGTAHVTFVILLASAQPVVPGSRSLPGAGICGPPRQILGAFKLSYNPAHVKPMSISLSMFSSETSRVICVGVEGPQVSCTNAASQHVLCKEWSRDTLVERRCTLESYTPTCSRSMVLTHESLSREASDAGVEQPSNTAITLDFPCITAW